MVVKAFVSPPTASISAEISSAPRLFVPLKSRCSRKCETPAEGPVSSREPTDTQMPNETLRTVGIASVRMRSPLGSTVRRTVPPSGSALSVRVTARPGARCAVAAPGTPADRPCPDRVRRNGGRLSRFKGPGLLARREHWTGSCPTEHDRQDTVPWSALWISCAGHDGDARRHPRRLRHPHRGSGPGRPGPGRPGPAGHGRPRGWPDARAPSAASAGAASPSGRTLSR